MKHIYVTVLVPATVLVPIGVGLIKTVYKDVPSKTMLLYLLFAGITDVVERILGVHHVNNLPLLHFYTIVEYLFIVRYFQLILNTSSSKLFKISLIAFPVLSILDFIFIQDIHQYNSYPRPIAAIIIIAFCVYYFFRYSENEIKSHWFSVPSNWISAGLMIYFSSSLFYFAFLNIISQKANQGNHYMNLYFIFGGVHATLVLLMYLMVAVGFLQVKNER
ncbi:hypothetical protein [Mucilaginibacter ginsenosidivorax]|uniref:Uncharacterized protein n=1 Tax=Mucilaginibacter ginsenosidivorax TaxID=862126 RepID=A0A5B8W192_9SPHI|nr:hypothetical protein [Mucilaginibacter ginsenosidivorax]QEC77567.1 hypothetical protein FSB76_17045 [Mucilaginibacter ginsenosidivorax]